MLTTKKTFTYFLITTSVFLFGCTREPAFVHAPYNPKTDARLRASSLTVYFEKDCYSDHWFGGPGASVAAGAGWIFEPNTSIGMPRTSDSPTRYTEYVIKAGRPVAIKGYVQGDFQKGIRNCGPETASFIPKAGKDYEAAFHLRGWNSGCWITVQELTNDNGLISAKNINVSSSLPKCKPSEKKLK